MSTTMRMPKQEYVPSPEEISRMTAKIRKGWTPQVRATRRRMARVYQQLLLSGNNRSAA